MSGMEIIGVASAATSIAGVLSKSIKNVHELRSKYHAADLTFSVLDSQLNTLRNALDQMAQWSGNGCSDQLMQGSQSAVQGISALVRVLDDKLQTIQKNCSGDLTIHGKLSFLWGQSELSQYLNLLNGQIMSLSILLHAYTCNSIADQQAVMSDENSREVIQVAEDATSSLIENYDILSKLARSSMSSEDTGAWSREFAFDTYVTNSKVYRRALRATTMRRVKPSLEIREHPPAQNSPDDRPQSEPSPAAEDASKLVGSEELATGNGSKGDTLTFFFNDGEEAEVDTDNSSQSSGTILQDSMTGRLADPSSAAVYPAAADVQPDMNSSSSSDKRNEQPHEATRMQKKAAHATINPFGKLPAVRSYDDRFTNSNALDKYELSNNVSSMTFGSYKRAKSANITKVLLLGASEVGKTTILKSLGFCLAGGLSTEERREWRHIIRANVIESFHMLFNAMKERDTLFWKGIPGAYAIFAWIETEVWHDYVDFDHVHITSEQCRIMQEIWYHPYTRQFLRAHGDRFALIPSAESRAESLERIFKAYYVPTDSDILKARACTQDIYTTTFRYGDGRIRISDVAGVRSKRTSWMHAFDRAQIVVFVASLISYERVLREDVEANLMEESLHLWETIVNSARFPQRGFVLVLTHWDLLEEKVRSSPTIKRYFPDFSGDVEDFFDVSSYFETKFSSMKRGSIKLPMKVVFTGLYGDRKEPGEIVLNAIKEVKGMMNKDSEHPAIPS